MKIICIGRNYAQHAKELNNPLPKVPIFFLKPESALLKNNKPFFYPEFSKEIHYETEVVVRIDRVGKHIEKQFAHRYYSEVALGIDFTARDRQRECKEKGLPWEIAKAFDASAPISEFVSLYGLGKKVDNLNFKLDIDQQTVQEANSGEMIFSVDEIIAYVSQFFTLKMGDLIFTGTPQGVGAVQIGNRLQAYLDDRLMLDFEIK